MTMGLHTESVQQVIDAAMGRTRATATDLVALLGLPPVCPNAETKRALTGAEALLSSGRPSDYQGPHGHPVPSKEVLVAGYPSPGPIDPWDRDDEQDRRLATLRSDLSMTVEALRLAEARVASLKRRLGERDASLLRAVRL